MGEHEWYSLVAMLRLRAPHWSQARDDGHNSDSLSEDWPLDGHTCHRHGGSDTRWEGGRCLACLRTSALGAGPRPPPTSSGPTGSLARTGEGRITAPTSQASEANGRFARGMTGVGITCDAGWADIL